LIPWSVVCLLQGDTARGIGLLAVYAVVWLVRSVLEPRLVGKELGLDPLVTLFSVYAGLRLLGIGGMLLAPFAAMVATQLIRQRPQTA
jgi:predicted PurR-regulated permease PerM